MQWIYTVFWLQFHGEKYMLNINPTMSWIFKNVHSQSRETIILNIKSLFILDHWKYSEKNHPTLEKIKLDNLCLNLQLVYYYVI